MQLFHQATSSFTKTEWKTRDRKPKHVVMMIMPFSSRDRNGGHLNRWPPLPLLHYLLIARELIPQGLLASKSLSFA
jgi:hypothetical protein